MIINEAHEKIIHSGIDPQYRDTLIYKNEIFKNNEKKYGKIVNQYFSIFNIPTPQLNNKIICCNSITDKRRK